MSTSAHPNCTVIDHPLVTHKLSLMRDETTPSVLFRQLLHEISLFLGYEVLHDLPMETRAIKTPVGPMDARVLTGKKLTFVPVLRAGLGLLDGFLELVPAARVGHIGLYRDPETLSAVEYFCKLPEDIDQRLTIVLDPMLATGNSAAAAVARLRAHGAGEIRLVCLLAAPEGLRAMAEQHPGVHVFTAAIDHRLDEHGYIVPGLGDAGDRMYGTR